MSKTSLGILISEKVLTGGRRTSAENAREVFNAIVLETFNTGDEASGALTGAEFLPLVQDGVSKIIPISELSTYFGGGSSSNLSIILDNGNSTGEKSIVSDDDLSNLNVINGEASLTFNDGTNIGYFFADNTGASMYGGNGVDYGNIIISPSQTTLSHTQKINLDSPVVNINQGIISSPDGTTTYSLLNTGYSVIQTAHAGNSSQLIQQDSSAQLTWTDGTHSGSLYLQGSDATLQHSNEIILDAPIYHFSQLSASTLVYLNSSKNMVSLAAGSTGQVLTISGGLPTWATPAATGVTAISIASANGFTGSSSGGSTPALTIQLQNADATHDGKLIQADWTTFNNKQTALSGNGFIKISGTTISYDASTYLTTGSAASTYAPINNPTFTGTVVLGQDASSGLQAVTYQQFQLGLLGRNDKEAAKYTTTAALPTVVYNNGSSGVNATLTAVSFGAISFDSATPAVGDRVNVKDQVSSFQNGPYVVTTVGGVATLFVLTRASDFNQSSEIFTGSTIYVTSGNTLGNTTWVYNGIDNPVIGTDAITFVQTAGPGSYISGAGILISGTTISVASGGVTNSMLAGSISDANILSSSNWNTAYSNRISTFTTAGSSGAATLSSNTLNIPNYTLSGLGGTTLAAVNAQTLAVFASTTSAQLAGVLSDETGYSSGAFAVFSKSPSIDAPTITGHITIEGVTATGATGTGKFVFDTGPTLSNPIVGTQTANDNSTKAASTAYVDSNPIIIRMQRAQRRFYYQNF